MEETFCDDGEDDDVVKSIRVCMSDTISLMQDYLYDIISQWKEILQITRSHIIRLAHSIKEDRSTVHRVRERCRNQNPDVERNFFMKSNEFATY